MTRHSNAILTLLCILHASHIRAKNAGDSRVSYLSAVACTFLAPEKSWMNQNVNYKIRVIQLVQCVLRNQKRQGVSLFGLICPPLFSCSSEA